MKSLLLSFCVACVPALSSAQNFTYEGLKYVVKDADAKTCEVTGVAGTAAASVVIPESVDYDGAGYSVVSIGDQAFFYNMDIESVSMPSSVTNIGEFSFCWCTYLSEVNFSPAVVSIGENAFNSCASLRAVELPAALTAIGEGAFSSCKLLSDVSIPASVTEIGDNAFGECPSLSNINVDDGNTVYHSVDGVLLSADMKTLLLYPGGKPLKDYVMPQGVETIRVYAFGGCSNLESVTFASTVRTVCEGAFYTCEKLSSVKLNDGLVEMGPYAFANDAALTSVDIPNTVTQMYDGVFMSCTSLGEVKIGDGVTSMGQFVFYSCNPLREVVLPAGLKSIGQYCFDETSLQSITSLNAEPPVCGASAFSNATLSSAVLSVPENSIDTYRSAAVWKDFGTIQASAGVTAPVAGDQKVVFAHGRISVIGGEGMVPVKVYDMNGRCVYAGYEAEITHLAPGIYIVCLNGATFKGVI